MRYGIAAVPRAIFTHQAALGLTPQQVWFVCYVLSFQWDASLPYPSINKMAERTGYSKRQLLRIKEELVLAGYLEVVRRTSSDRGNDTNAYDFSPLFDTIRQQLQSPQEAEASAISAVPGEAGDASEADEDSDSISYDGDTEAEDITDEQEETARHLNRRTRPAQPRQRNIASLAGTADANPKLNVRPVEPDVTRGVAHNVTGWIERGVTGRVEREGTGPIEQRVAKEVVQGVTGLVTFTAGIQTSGNVSALVCRW